MQDDGRILLSTSCPSHNAVSGKDERYFLSQLFVSLFDPEFSATVHLHTCTYTISILLNMFRPTHLWMVIAALLASAVITKAQQLLSPQNNTFASAVSLTQEQLLKAGINDTVANNIEVALNFERSNLGQCFC